MMSPTLEHMLITLWLICIIFTIGCPNEQFKYIADYKKSFKITPPGKLYYIAIGSAEKAKWGIGFLSPTAEGRKYVCHRDSIGVGAPYARDKKRKMGFLRRVTATICCYAAADALDSRFLILPKVITEDVQKKVADGKGKLPQPKSDYEATYYWYQKPAITSIDRYLALVFSGREGKTEHPTSYIPNPDYDESPGMFLHASNLKLDIKYKFQPIDLGDDYKCEQPHTLECDTGIQGEIVGFIYDAIGDAKRISFAYSQDGLFKADKLFPDLRAATGESPPNVYYFSISKWFELADEAEPKFATYGGWQLGSACAACPSTSMKITITEAEARMNKERFEHAISLGFNFGGRKEGILLGGSIGYTYKNIKESATTLTSGRSTVITSVCNGFYIYYWAVTIGSWGGLIADRVPTQRFYCTDWPKPPICLPRVKDMEDNPDDLKRVCRDDDNPADFCGNPKEMDEKMDKKMKSSEYHTKCMKLQPDKTKQSWWSKHQGRPQPMRIVGQDTTTEQQKPLQLLTEPAAAAAKYIPGVWDDLMQNDYNETDEQQSQFLFVIFVFGGICLCCICAIFVASGIMGYFVTQEINFMK